MGSPWPGRRRVVTCFLEVPAPAFTRLPHPHGRPGAGTEPRTPRGRLPRPGASPPLWVRPCSASAPASSLRGLDTSQQAPRPQDGWLALPLLHQGNARPVASPAGVRGSLAPCCQGACVPSPHHRRRAVPTFPLRHGRPQRRPKQAAQTSAGPGHSPPSQPRPAAPGHRLGRRPAPS